MDRQPWNRIKPPEYHASSTSDFERMQWACGIPPRHWSVQLDSLSFAKAEYEGKKEVDLISSKIQEDYFKERMADPELLCMNRFVCITSHPSDEQALAAACLLATAYIEDAWNSGGAIKCRVDDIQDYEQCVRLDKEFYSVSPEVVMIYNLNENSGHDRLRLAADLLKKFEGTYRVAVAACDSPLRFARDFLRMEPQEVYHFEGKRLKRMHR